MATKLSLTKGLEEATVGALFDNAKYELKIDTKFMKDSPIQDMAMLLEVIEDFIASNENPDVKLNEGKLTVLVKYEQNKREKSFNLVLTSELSIIKQRRYEKELKLAKLQTDTSALTSKTLINSRELSQFVTISLSNISFKLIIGDLKKFLTTHFTGTHNTLEKAEKFLSEKKYNIFMTWLTHKSYKESLHYYSGSGIRDVRNEKIEMADGQITFIIDKSIRIDYDMLGVSDCNEIIFTMDDGPLYINKLAQKN